MGLGMTGLDQPVFDAVLITGAVAAMTSGRVAFAGGATVSGNVLAVIGQDVLHREGRLRDESLEKSGRMSCHFLAEHLAIHPARGAINGHE